MDEINLSAVVYCRNQQKTIGQQLRSLDRQLTEAFQGHEIIVVDDGSNDGTSQTALDISSELQGKLTVISLEGRHGVSTAMDAGTDLAAGQLIMEVEVLGAALQQADLSVLAAAPGPWDVVLARPGNILRLVTPRAVQAMERNRTMPLGRNTAYHFCGLPVKTLPIPGLTRHWRREAEQLLANLPVHQGFVWLMAGILLATAWAFWLWPRVLIERRVIMGVVLLLFTLDFSIGLMARKTSTPDYKYKVRRIHRT